MHPNICCGASSSALNSTPGEEQQGPLKNVKHGECYGKRLLDDPLIKEKTDNLLRGIKYTKEDHDKYRKQVMEEEGFDIDTGKAYDSETGEWLTESSDDDEDEFGREFTEEERAKYTQQIQQSGGYDVDDFPEVSEFGMIVPLRNLKSDLHLYNDLRKYSILAIEDYNKKEKEEYEFVEIVKANIQGAQGFNCWITFRARYLGDPNSNVEPKIFQAKVYGGIDKVIVDECHPKNNS